VAGQRTGYVTVSTLDQNGQRQLDGLVLDRVFTDQASGRDTARPQLTELLGFRPRRGRCRRSQHGPARKESG
jgi:hypothetical protein